MKIFDRTISSLNEGREKDALVAEKVRENFDKSCFGRAAKKYPLINIIAKRRTRLEPGELLEFLGVEAQGKSTISELVRDEIMREIEKAKSIYKFDRLRNVADELYGLETDGTPKQRSQYRGMSTIAKAVLEDYPFFLHNLGVLRNLKIGVEFQPDKAAAKGERREMAAAGQGKEGRGTAGQGSGKKHEKREKVGAGR